MGSSLKNILSSKLAIFAGIPIVLFFLGVGVWAWILRGTVLGYTMFAVLCFSSFAVLALLGFVIVLIWASAESSGGR